MTNLEKIASISKEAADAVVRETAEELVDKIAEQFEDASPEDIAKTAADVLDEALEMKAAEVLKEAKEDKPTYPISRFMTSPLASAGIGSAGALASLLRGGGSVPRALAAGALTGGAYYGLADLNRRITARALKGRIEKGKGLIGKEKELRLGKKAEFDTDVVKTARDILASNGFDPNTGERLSKVKLARSYEEAKLAAALELLEANNWPVQWNPAFLARAKEVK